MFKEADGVDDSNRVEKKRLNKCQTSNNFYNNKSLIRDYKEENEGKKVKINTDINFTDDLRRTKYLVEKLSGKVAMVTSFDQKRSNSPLSPKSINK
jgi:hypothetical protein